MNSRVRFVLASAAFCAAACTPEPAINGPMKTAEDSDVRVDVPFVTNRNIEEDDEGNRRFGNEIGEISAGSCRVGLEVGDGYEGELLGVSRDSTQTVFEALDPSPLGGIVVYIHGYYEDFDRNCRRASIFKHRLGANADFLMFSWPANSSALDYTEDVEDMQRSTPAFLDLIDRLGERFGPERVNIVAHSLGSRAAVRALQNWTPGNRKYRSLVLVAADMDRSEFIEALPELQARVTNITVLASDRDRPLRASEAVNDAPRLGQADDVDIDGVKLIDVTAIADEHFSGHVYHLRNAKVAQIIRQILIDAPEEAGKLSIP